MKITLHNIRDFCFLANPERTKFSDYWQQLGERPTYYIEPYLKEYSANSESVKLFSDSGLLNSIHGNYRKVCLGNGVGQAFMDAAIMSGMCKSMVTTDNGTDSTKAKDLEDYLDFSSTCALRIIREMEQLPVTLFESVPSIHSVVSDLENSYKNYILVEKTIIYILYQWKHNPMKVYDFPYSYFIEKVKNNA